MAKTPRLPPERDISKFALNSIRWVALGSSGLSGLALGSGTYPDAVASSGAFGGVLAVAVGIVAAGGLATGWHYTLGIASHAEEPHKKALAAVLGVGLCGIGAATSAWFLCEKIGGASALQTYQVGYVQELRNAHDTVGANGAAEQGILAAIETGGAALRSKAESEDAAALISGKRRGKGVVYRTLNDAADNLANMATKLQSIAGERDEKLTDAKRTLDEATRAIAARDAAQFETAATRAATEISAADRMRLAATASGLGSSQTSDYARAPIAATFDEIRKVTRLANNNRREVMVPVFVPIDAKEAVKTNPPVLAWMAALLIETIPLILLAVLLVLWREERDDNDEQAPPASIAEPRPRPTLVASE